MTITVESLGTWTVYEPSTRPAGVPDSVMFCKSDLDGMDWYQFLKNDPFNPNEVIALARQENDRWIVRMATRDATRLWPAGSVLLAWEDTTQDDPQTKYEGMVYNNNTIAIDTFVPVPATISDRQFFQQLYVDGIITEEQALASNAAVIPPPLEAIIEAMPSNTQFAAKMIVSGATIFHRSHPMTEAIGAAYGWTSTQIDDFFRQASLL